MKPWSVLIVIAFVVVLFQNCGVPKPFYTSGNGNGYGGAPTDQEPFPGGGSGSPPVLGQYMNYLDGVTCDDGSNVRARILYSANGIFLNREDCAELNPAVQINQFDLIIGFESLQYDGRVFNKGQ